MGEEIEVINELVLDLRLQQQRMQIKRERDLITISTPKGEIKIFKCEIDNLVFALDSICKFRNYQTMMAHNIPEQKMQRSSKCIVE